MSIDIAAFDLITFTKSHEYPKENSKEFGELTMLLDKLETELRTFMGIRGAWPVKEKQ